MSYSLYGGPYDGREVDSNELAPGQYTVVVPPEDGAGPAEYHLRTVRARVATGGTLMIDVLAHSPYDEAALWARVLDDFAATIERVEIRLHEVRHTQERPRVHLRLVGLTPGRRPSASLDASAGWTSERGPASTRLMAGKRVGPAESWSVTPTPSPAA